VDSRISQVCEIDVLLGVGCLKAAWRLWRRRVDGGRWVPSSTLFSSSPSSSPLQCGRAAPTHALSSRCATAASEVGHHGRLMHATLLRQQCVRGAYAAIALIRFRVGDDMRHDAARYRLACGPRTA
jgi:hypothetical protein